MIVFPVPPVYTGNWTGIDWDRYIEIHGVESEPVTIENGFVIWDRTGELDINGEVLYSLRKETTL